MLQKYDGAECLPDEIWQRIFYYLIITNQIQSIGKVCRRFYHLWPITRITVTGIVNQFKIKHLAELVVYATGIVYTKLFDNKLYKLDWNTQSKIILNQNHLIWNASYNKLYLSPNEKYLFAVQNLGTLEIWDLHTNKRKKIFFENDTNFNSLIGYFAHNNCFAFIRNDIFYQLSICEVKLDGGWQIKRPSYWNIKDGYRDEQIATNFGKALLQLWLRDNYGQIYEYRLYDETCRSPECLLDNNQKTYGMYPINNNFPLFNNLKNVKSLQSILRTHNICLENYKGCFICLKPSANINCQNDKHTFVKAFFSTDTQYLVINDQKKQLIMINLLTLNVIIQPLFQPLKTFKIAASSQLVAYNSGTLVFFKPLTELFGKNRQQCNTVGDSRSQNIC